MLREDLEEFYPIVFRDENWDDGPIGLEINRPMSTRTPIR